MTKVLLVDPLYDTPQWQVQPGWLGSEHEVIRPQTYNLADIMPLLGQVEGILTVLVPVTAEMLDAASRLRVVAKPGAGVEYRCHSGHQPLRAIDRVIISPHQASRTPETQRAAMERTRENTLRALAGVRPINIVNPEVLA
jgi:phosphoglycerate dehydrogenase-like enzyme